MTRYLLIPIIAALLLLPVSVFSKERREITFDGGLTLSFELPSDRWQVSRQVPESLVKETVDHVSFHMQEEGREVPAELEGKVRERLGQNELYIHNPVTTAHLDVDLSAIRTGESPPSVETVARSAEFAKDELTQEKDLSEVKSVSKQITIDGARSAHRIDASYLRDGESRTFVGIIGYQGGYWFFFYYTDKNHDPRDLVEIEALLSSLRLARSGG